MYWYVLWHTCSYQFVLVHPCTCQYVLICTNTNYRGLWSDEGNHHHEHFHSITSHLDMFLAINVNVVEVAVLYKGDRVTMEVCPPQL